MNLIEQRKNLLEKINSNFDQANKLWFELLRHIITLSSSFLVITLALVDKLFPDINSISNMPIFLLISWFMFLIAIFLALITFSKEIIFFGNIGRSRSKKLKEIDDLIAKGEVSRPLSNESYYINNKILSGVLSVDFFLLALFSLCLSFLESMISVGVCTIIFIVGLLIVAFLNFDLILKREQ